MHPSELRLMSQAGKPLYLVANWKSNKAEAQIIPWVEGFGGFILDEQKVVIVCPPFPLVKVVYDALKQATIPFEVGVQDVSPYPYGAYTGAVAAEMVKNWVKYAIVGHSERRRYFKETDQEVANKVSRCLEAGLTPIVCVDEPYLESQIEALETEAKTQCVFAYEPVSAIGSGHPDTPEHAESVALRIQGQVGAEGPVLYGGSVTTDNIKSFTDQPHITGALVGGASLEPESWKALIG